MDQLLQSLIDILAKQGWVIALIALLSIVLLGILKYCNVFKKLDETYRHAIYILISVGASIIGTIIDLACTGNLTADNVLMIASIMFMINQTAYAVYANTPLKTLLQKLFQSLESLIKIIGTLINSKKDQTANKEQVEEDKNEKELLEDPVVDNQSEEQNLPNESGQEEAVEEIENK